MKKNEIKEYENVIGHHVPDKMTLKGLERMMNKLENEIVMANIYNKRLKKIVANLTDSKIKRDTERWLKGELDDVAKRRNKLIKLMELRARVVKRLGLKDRVAPVRGKAEERDMPRPRGKKKAEEEIEEDEDDEDEDEDEDDEEEDEEEEPPQRRSQKARGKRRGR